jgi:hypothetical protein
MRSLDQQERIEDVISRLDDDGQARDVLVEITLDRP